MKTYPLANFLPSVGWFLFMMMGALHNFHIYHHYLLPFISLSVVLIVFLASDTISYLISSQLDKPYKVSGLTVTSNVSTRTVLFLFIISILLLVMRFQLVGTDILRLLMEHKEKVIITQARVAHLNNVGSRHILFILQNIGFSFLFPITAILLKESSRKFLHLLFTPFLVLVMLSSIMGGERFTFFSFITPLIIWLLSKFSLRPIRRIIAVVVLPIIIIALTTVNTRINSYNRFAVSPDFLVKFSYKSESSLGYAKYLPKEPYLHLLDRYTISDLALSSTHPIDNSIRRLLLVPSDVSYHYFKVFPTLLPHPYSFGQYRSGKYFSGMTLSNIVGNIVYRAKYPDKYLAQVSAYCSFDADAYARFGPVGIIISALLLLIFRLASSINRSTDVFSNLIYLCIVSSLFWLPSIASVQAMFISHGYLLALLLLLTRRYNFLLLHT